MKALKRPSTLVAPLSWPSGAATRDRSLPLPRRELLLPWLLPLGILLLWYFAARGEWLPAQMLPGPAAVLATLAELFASGELATSFQVSLVRIGVGFASGAAAGLLLGALLALWRPARDYLAPTLRAVFAVPTIGWIPILILIFGIDETLKFLIVAKAVLVPVTLHTAEGIRQIPARFRELADVLGLRGWARLRYVTGPSALPVVCNGLRLGLSSAFIALVVVEMLAATEGLGYMMVWGRTLFQLDIVLGGIVLVGLIGFLLDRLLSRGMARLRRGLHGNA